MGLEINFEELEKLLTDPRNFVLDVREAQEIKTDGAIPGSVNLPLSRIESLSGDAESFREAVGRPIETTGSNMILSCKSGRRALMAFDKVKSLGYDEAKVYKGSFLDWQSKGGKVVKE